LKTQHLTLLPHHPDQLRALFQGPEEYEKITNKRLAHGVREFLLAASQDFVDQLQTATAPDPWRLGFAIVHRTENVVIGLCGFTGPPAPDGTVEIAYSTAPAYEGKGYATEAAGALVDFALESGRVTKVYAHTLPEINASTRILEKCGFKKTAEIVDQENNLVWRWERPMK
jgi:ribosomal-protein-alanine N-acetyltransferase